MKMILYLASLVILGIIFHFLSIAYPPPPPAPPCKSSEEVTKTCSNGITVKSEQTYYMREDVCTKSRSPDLSKWCRDQTMACANGVYDSYEKDGVKYGTAIYLDHEDPIHHYCKFNELIKKWEPTQ